MEKGGWGEDGDVFCDHDHASGFRVPTAVWAIIGLGRPNVKCDTPQYRTIMSRFGDGRGRNGRRGDESVPVMFRSGSLG